MDRPFRQSFPDFRMDVLDVIAEAEKVVGYFKCSGTHEGEWLGCPATGRRFQDVDEIYILRVEHGKLDSALAVVEDSLARMRQLGLVETLTEFPDGDHCVTNHPHEKHALVASLSPGRRRLREFVAPGRQHSETGFRARQRRADPALREPSHPRSARAEPDAAADNPPSTLRARAGRDQARSDSRSARPPARDGGAPVARARSRGPWRVLGGSRARVRAGGRSRRRRRAGPGAR